MMGFAALNPSYALAALSVIARSVSDEAIQIDAPDLDCFAFGSQ
jgi:hypothetical protein